jgi:mannosyltransferase OCH1-like enzyme
MPRLIHFIWLGPKPVPATFAAILEMWRQHHSDFEIKVWGEKDLPSLELANLEIIMDTQLNPALRSDFLRLELLFKFGGIYADVDMTCERPLTPLLRTNFDLITGLSNTLAFECNNGLILSKPACQFVATMIGDLKASF